jgi:hypothetical protein
MSYEAAEADKPLGDVAGTVVPPAATSDAGAPPASTGETMSPQTEEKIAWWKFQNNRRAQGYATVSSLRITAVCGAFELAICLHGEG